MTDAHTTVFDLLQNQGLTAGFVVMSRAGHDTGRVYLVLRVEGRFAWLADGHYRPLDRPKRKRIRHLKPLGSLRDPDWLGPLAAMNDAGQQNAALRRLIENFTRQQNPNETQSE